MRVKADYLDAVKKEHFCIVLAKVEMTGIRSTGKYRFDGGNHFLIYEPAPQAKAVVWLNRATRADLKKAEDFAKTEGYTVFTYQNEREPLQRAKRDIMERQ